MKRQLIKIGFITFITILTFSCKKEDDSNSNWITYNTKNGLLNNYVNAIAIDLKGNHWFGCGSYSIDNIPHDGGVSKFDGTNWITYNTHNGLTNNWVFSMALDEQGNIWIGTNGGGVSKFDGTNWTTYTTDNGLGGNDVWSIAIDEKGNKWFGSIGGLTKFDGKNWKTYNTGQVITIVIDNDGNKWFGSGWGGLWKLDNNEKLYNYIIKGKESNGFIIALAIDNQGNKWCSDSVGVSKFDGENWTTYTTDDGLASNEVNCIAADKQGNLLVGTNNGVSKFDGNNWINYMPKKYVKTITFDSTGTKWLSISGEGVIEWKD